MEKKEVYLLGALRSPQAKAGGELKDVDSPFLASYLVRYLLDQAKIPNDGVDEVVIGNVGTPAKYSNIGRVVALEAGLAHQTPAYTVNRNCASGLEAIAQGMLKIETNRANLIVAGGVESMSGMPLMYGPEMKALFAKIFKAKTPFAKLQALKDFRPRYLAPEIAIEQGLKDPFCGLNMGQTAELLAREMKITREEQDVFANSSHLKAVSAIEKKYFKDEILPIVVGKKIDRILESDCGPRADSSVQGLAKMRPYFDRKSGTVTIGNSCPITDGGSIVLLGSEEILEKYRLEPIARLVDVHFSGLEPERMGMGPLLALDGVFKKCGMSLEEMDLIEINEAFAAQTLAVLKGCKEKSWSTRFGLEKPPGEIPPEKLNVNGGAISLGHPVGSTGSRLLVTLSHELKRRKNRFGLAALCIGGGQGGAIVVENLKR